MKNVILTTVCLALVGCKSEVVEPKSEASASASVVATAVEAAPAASASAAPTAAATVAPAASATPAAADKK